MMIDRPSAEAKRVLSAHSITGCPAEHLQSIADAEHIKVLFRSIEDEPDFGGQLVYKGNKAGILVNTCIPNSGRHHFTFAHELGHYFLRHTPAYTMDDQRGFRCTAKDMETSRNPQETEANRFAAALLMPEEQFRFAMIGAVLDYALISNLARQFRVSKHACCNRLLEFTKEPYIVVRSKGFEVTEIRTSLAARGKISALKQIPQDTAAYTAITMKRNQGGFTECAPSRWTINLPASFPLYEWTHGAWEHGVAMTILRF